MTRKNTGCACLVADLALVAGLAWSERGDDPHPAAEIPGSLRFEFQLKAAT
jgi:hypothetical protein